MVACLAMALAGFLTFGDKTLGNVLNNFPKDNTMINIARLQVSQTSGENGANLLQVLWAQHADNAST